MKALFERILGFIFIGGIFMLMLILRAWSGDKYDDDDYYD